ncbi:MAG: hypothetical protein ABH842_04405 [Candidatus Micrarchaeota archaeon]
MRRLFLSGPSKVAMVTALAVTVASCGATASMIRDRPSEKPQTTFGAPLHEQHVLSLWSKGVCTYSGGYVTYSSNNSGQIGELKLDVDLFNPQEILCSDKFTVIFDNDFAIVALGSEKILEGVPSFGVVSGSFVAANSYKLRLGLIMEDGGINKTSIDGNTLTVFSNNGNSWQLDLSNPHDGWSIY